MNVWIVSRMIGSLPVKMLKPNREDLVDNRRETILHILEIICIIWHFMPDKTERSNCRFSVKRAADGKSVLIVQLYQETIPALKNTILGFDLLGGLQPEAATKLADTLNEHVLDLFLTSPGSAS